MHKSHLKIAYLSLVIAALAISGALIAQYGFNLKPCVLCLYQRYLWIATLLLALIFIFYRKAWAGLLLIFVLNAGTAAYQVGVEHKIFDLPSFCQASLTKALTLEQLSEQIMNTPAVRCDTVAWQMFGISMAGYNALLNLFLSILFAYHFIIRTPNEQK